MVAPEGERRQPLTVLVADDESSVRLLCRVNLEAEGMRVVEAVDGLEAVARALASPPDVAVLDLMMPGLRGWEVAERLRTNEVTERVGLVFLTAMSGVENEERARRLGGLFVGKPFDPRELPLVVLRAARRRG
jgi:two-component system phosphate regulon response regulator PhoB